jgi:hypothetical protein
MKYVIAIVVVAVVGYAIYYLLTHRGGGDAIVASGTGSGSSDAPKRCDVRVAAAGISVDGKPATQVEAVAACKGRPGADVVVTGDARQGDWDDLRAAFDASGIAIYLRR